MKRFVVFALAYSLLAAFAVGASGPPADDYDGIFDRSKQLVLAQEDKAKEAAAVEAKIKALQEQEKALKEKLAKEQAEKKGDLGRGRGYVLLTPEKRKYYDAVSNHKHGGRLAMMAANQTLPAAFDCREKGWVLKIGDQGSCGSCYLYSTVYGTMTQSFVKAGYGKADGSFVMAVQFGMDCQNFGGCNGGNGTEVIDWACRHAWPAESWVDPKGAVHKDYPPYEARSRSCRTITGAKQWTPASWGFVSADPNRPATIDEIKTAMVNYGGLNVSLDAGGQFGNGSGTITALGNSIDHEIEAIAYDDNKANPDGTKGALLLKNQWSEDWGDKGVRWLTYKAAARLVDIFFVVAAAQPPPPDPGPPPPPPPPDPGPVPPPTPGKFATITVMGTGDSQVTTITGQFPQGSSYVIPRATLERTFGDLLGVQGFQKLPPIIDKK